MVFPEKQMNPKANSSFPLAFYASSVATSITVGECVHPCLSVQLECSSLICLHSRGHVIFFRPHSVLLCKGCWEHTSACTDEDHASSRCYCIHCDSSLDSRCQLLEGLYSRLQNPALSNTDMEQRRNKTSSRTKRVRVRDSA